MTYLLMREQALPRELVIYCKTCKQERSAEKMPGRRSGRGCGRPFWHWVNVCLWCDTVYSALPPSAGMEQRDQRRRYREMLTKERAGQLRLAV